MAGDVERGAVIGAGADERQPERDVDAVLDAEIFHRDEAMVVRHGHNDVELARVAFGVAGRASWTPVRLSFTTRSRSACSSS